MKKLIIAFTVLGFFGAAAVFAAEPAKSAAPAAVKPALSASQKEALDKVHADFRACLIKAGPDKAANDACLETAKAASDKIRGKTSAAAPAAAQPAAKPAKK